MALVRRILDDLRGPTSHGGGPGVIAGLQGSIPGLGKSLGFRAGQKNLLEGPGFNPHQVPIQTPNRVRVSLWPFFDADDEKRC